MLVVEDLDYLLHHDTTQWHTKYISLTRPNANHMVDGHFVDDYFFSVLEEKDSVHDTVDCIWISNEALSSKL
jgi:hypothetical protein